MLHEIGLLCTVGLGFWMALDAMLFPTGTDPVKEMALTSGLSTNF